MSRLVLLFISFALLLPGCLFTSRGPALPVDNTITRDQLVIFSDFDLPRRHRLINELVALRGDLAAKLQLPMSDEPIHIYLFDSSEDYKEFMHEQFPEFANRRAFFVKTDTRLTVYAFWGERVAEDLRHEVAHGYLHAVVPNLPLWLDEGLAEYFETPRGMRGVHRQHAELLMTKYDKDQWTPDLKAIEQMDDAATMTQMEYAESWLWAHLLLESTVERREMLQTYVEKLKSSGNAPAISQTLSELETSTERTLIRHLKSMTE